MSAKKKIETSKKQVSRREFLVAGGAVLAAGALAACSPKTTTETVTNTQTVTNTVTATPAAQTTTVTGSPTTVTKTVSTTAPAVTATTTVTAEKVYEVVSPLAERVVKMITMAPRLDTLDGKIICFHGSPDFKAPVTHAVLYQLLKQKYPKATIIPYTDMPGWDKNAAADIFTDYMAAVKAKGVQAIISGNGG
jgi:hypothetical protein